jgi:preflagellin peptidase FlaK
VIASGPDLLRLLVLPVFAWAAWRDVRTRRLPNRLWPPLFGLGLLALGWELLARWPLGTFSDRLFLMQAGLSLLVIAPLGYGFWWIGAFGGADAKAMIAIAVLLPTFPRYLVGGTALPVAGTQSGVFSLTVLTNTVILAMAVPLVLAAHNAARGNVVPAAMFLARPVAIESLPDRHGRLFETPAGITRRGLDLDALRMYLRWRGTTLAAVRADPAGHRNPASIEATADPTDGATHVGPRTDGGVDGGVNGRIDGGVDAGGEAERETDPWGAERFFADIEGSAYGSTPEKLRAALDLVAAPDRETVWVSPGLPFVVPMFAGLVVAFGYGDLLFGLLGWLGAI